MIAVSQNLVLGYPVASLGGAIGIADGPADDGSAFLQAFALDDVAPVMAEDTIPGPDTKMGAEADLLDGSDADVIIGVLIADGAIWQPIAHTIAALPMPGSGGAVLANETETGSTSALLAEDGVSTHSSGQPYPIGETVPQPSEDAANTGEKNVAPTDDAPAAGSGRDVEVPKTTIALATSLTVGSPIGNPQKALEPALSTPPKAFTPDSDSGQQQNVAPDVLQQASAPKPLISWLTEPAKQLDPARGAAIYDQDMPAQKSTHIARVSASEAAWRQKWIGDVSALYGNDASAGDERNMSVKTDAGSATRPLVALASPLIEAGEKAVLPDPGDPASIIKNLEFSASAPLLKTGAPETKAINQFAATAPLADRTNPLADITSATPASFEAVDTAAAALPAAAPQPAISPLVPLPSPAPPTLPTAVSPTIVELSKSGNDGPLELALSPEELGRLTISIKHDGDFVRVTVIADRPETLDLMRRHGGDLLADLRQAGFSGASLSFGQGGQGGQPRFANAEALMKSQSTPQQLPPETKPTAPNRSRKGSGVDLRF